MRMKTISLLFVLVVLNCSGRMKISDVSSMNAKSEWTQLGGNAQHDQNAIQEITPPLKLLWKVGVERTPTGYMTAAKENIFVTTMAGKVIALNYATGARVSSIKLEQSLGYGMALDGNNGYFGSITDENSIFGYQLDKGKYSWKKRIGSVESMPLVSGGLLYVSSVNGNIYCLDLETGSEKWKFNSNRPFRGTPARWEGLIIAANDSGIVYGLSASTGELKWKYQTGKAIMSTPVIHNGIIYVGNLQGEFFSINAESGELIWSFSGKGSFFTTASVDDEAVYSATASGILYKISIADGVEIWQKDLLDPLSIGMLVSGQYIYIGSLNRNFYSLDKDTGEILWSVLLDGRIRTSPLEYNGNIFIGTENRFVYAFSEVGAAGE